MNIYHPIYHPITYDSYSHNSAARNVSSSILELKEEAHSPLDQVAEKELDASDIEDLTAEADPLVEEAQKTHFQNSRLTREKGTLPHFFVLRTVNPFLR